MTARFNCEIGKIPEHPIVFERVEDCVEKFPGNSDVGLAHAAPGFDFLVKIAQVGAVALGNECTLHQLGAGNFALALGDPSNTKTIVGRLTPGVLPRKAARWPC